MNTQRPATITISRTVNGDRGDYITMELRVVGRPLSERIKWEMELAAFALAVTGASAIPCIMTHDGQLEPASAKSLVGYPLPNACVPCETVCADCTPPDAIGHSEDLIDDAEQEATP